MRVCAPQIFMTQSRYPLISIPAPAAARCADPLEEKTVKRELLLDGRFIRIYRDDVTLPDGSSSFRVFLTHPGAAAVLPLYDDGTVILERQWRHPCGCSFWEIPAGKLDPNESERVCAERELSEECGIEAERFDYLGTVRNAIGYSSEHIAVYLARGLKEVDQHLDSGEFLEVWRVPFEEALAMCFDGRIVDSKTMAAFFWAQKFLDGKRRAVEQ